MKFWHQMWSISYISLYGTLMYDIIIWYSHFVDYIMNYCVISLSYLRVKRANYWYDDRNSHSFYQHLHWWYLQLIQSNILAVTQSITREDLYICTDLAYRILSKLPLNLPNLRLFHCITRDYLAKFRIFDKVLWNYDPYCTELRDITSALFILTWCVTLNLTLLILPSSTALWKRDGYTTNHLWQRRLGYYLVV